ncbi:MAG: T9SS type A sorting domain-containing protein [Bacteroidales bacterium]|nr:T9SS type A sorting domain-containing protein [Bacteroidales bacterium]
MKKIFIWAWLLVGILSAKGQNVALDVAHFPDVTFRNYLKTEFDVNNNNILDSNELEAITEINVSNMGIFSLQGVEYLFALTELNCSNNALTSLDVSNLIYLEDLHCHYNSLNTLITTGAVSIDHIDCYNNQLSSIDLSTNTAIKMLTCNYNHLTRLDLSHNTDLVSLYCHNNLLTNLDVSHLSSLENLYCYNNLLDTLLLGNISSLKILYCNDNKLTSLYLNNNINLETLYCYGNRLTTLDVSNNSHLTTFSCYGNLLTSLDIENTNFITNVNSTYWCDGNACSIVLPKNVNTFNLNLLPGNFDISRAGNWQGGDASDSILTFYQDVVSYDYAVGKNDTVTFFLYAQRPDNHGIAINNRNFPDPIFKAYLRDNFDDNHNDTLSLSECLNIYKINVKGMGISDLKGIEHFSKLLIIDCEDNQLSNINLSNNSLLMALYTSNNHLTELDLSNNSQLKFLWCGSNHLTSLSLDHLQYLRLDWLWTKDNVYDIALQPDYSFDLTSLPGNFDIRLAGQWSGCSINGTLLTNISIGQPVTYTYDCGQNISTTFTLRPVGLVSVADASPDNYRIYGYNRHIYILHADNNPVEIYNMSGQRIASKYLHSDFESIFMPAKGIYIVKINSFSKKVLIE